MLDLMRRHAKNWLMKTLLGMIIVVFVLYFGSMGGRERAERVAVIDGKPIVYADFRREYGNLIEAYRQRFGQDLSEEMLKALDVKRQAFDNLINQAVILAKAKELHIEVSDEEVQRAILSYPPFQRNGVFDQRLYEQNLRIIKMGAEEFEENQRKMLITLKLQDLILDAVRVSEQEVRDFYVMQKEKIAVEFMEISPKDFLDKVKATTAELEDFMKAQEGRFRVPEQVELKYLAFLGSDYAARVSVSEAEIEDYYENNKAKWSKDKKTPPLSEVRDQIVRELRLTKGMYAAADAAKKAHDTIYQEENFDAYAAANKLAIQRTGLFKVTNPPPQLAMIPDFGKTLSQLQTNEVSRVLADGKGYYLIALVQRKAPYLPPLREVEAEVEKAYRQAQAKKLALKEAEAVLERLKKGAEMRAVAGGLGIKVQETGFFSPAGSVPKLGSSPELMEALFKISEKVPYPERPYWVDDGYFIVRFKQREKVDDSDFAARKEAIAETVLQIKRAEALRSWLEGSREDLIREGRLEILKDSKDL